MKKILVVICSFLLFVSPTTGIISCQNHKNIYQPAKNDKLGAKITYFFDNHFAIFHNDSLNYNAIRPLNSSSSDDYNYFQTFGKNNSVINNMYSIINFQWDEKNNDFVTNDVNQFTINTKNIINLHKIENQDFDINKLYLALSPDKLPSIASLQSKLWLFLPNNYNFTYSQGTLLLPINSGETTIKQKQLLYFESINLIPSDFWAAKLSNVINNYFNTLLPTDPVYIPNNITDNVNTSVATKYFLSNIFSDNNSDYFFGNVKTLNISDFITFLDQFFNFKFSVDKQGENFTWSLLNKNNNLIKSVTHSYTNTKKP